MMNCEMVTRRYRARGVAGGGIDWERMGGSRPRGGVEQLHERRTKGEDNTGEDLYSVRNG